MSNNKIIALLKTETTLAPKISQAPSKVAIIFVGRKKKKSETPAKPLRILLPTDTYNVKFWRQNFDEIFSHCLGYTYNGKSSAGPKKYTLIRGLTATTGANEA